LSVIKEEKLALPSILTYPKALFASLEGKGEEGLGKKEVEEIEDIGRKGLWGAYFSSKYKTFLIWGN